MSENGDFLFDSIDFGDDLLTTDQIELDTIIAETEEEKVAREKAALKEGLIDSSEFSDSDNQEQNDGSADNTAASSSSPLSYIVSALGEELGIEINNEELDKLASDAEKAQYLRDLIQKDVEGKVKSNLSDEEVAALEAIRKGIPMKEYTATKANQRAYSNLKDSDIKSNEALQEVLVKNSLITRGFTEEKALKMIGSYKDAGGEELYNEAMEAKTFMIEKESKNEEALQAKADQDILDREKYIKESLEKTETFVMAQKEYIPGIELTESFKKDIYKSMTTAVAKDNRGNSLNEVYANRAKNPVEFEFRLATLFKMGLFNEKPDFSKFEKVAENKTARGLEKLLGENNNLSGGKNKRESDSNDLGLGIFS